MNIHVDDNNEITLGVQPDRDIDLHAGDTINIGSTDYEALTNKPQIEDVELVGNISLEDIGAASAADIPTKVSQLDNDEGYTAFSGSYNDLTDKPTIPEVPTNVSAFTNDAGYLSSETDPTVPSWAKQASKPAYTASEVGALPDTTVIPSKTSDLNNDSGFITTETDPTVPAWAKANTKPSYTAAEVGAVPTTRKVNNKALSADVSLTAADVSALPANTFIPTNVSDLNNDEGYISGMVILSYGNSTYADFKNAYDAKTVVYCRASSNSNPATGAQNRLAFMAYVNDASNPTEVEFQYYRSVSSHTESQQGDQVFVYKLTKTGGWTVTTREASSKVATSTGISKTYSNDTVTLALDSATQTSLGKADTAYQKPANGIPHTDLEHYYADAKAAGGAATNTQAIPYGVVDDTSTSTVYTATVAGITELKNGTCVMLRNGVATSAAGFTVNVNGLGAKPVYNNMAAATADTTIFNVNYTMLFVYDEDRVEGGCWVCYRGYNSDNNTIGYQLRTNSGTKPASDKGYRYRLWFTSADGTKWVPANTSTSTNATSARTPNTRPIDPFGSIIYYSTNGTTNANANLSATTQWEQYTLSLGYSFNTTGAALVLTYPAPVYIKCTPLANGSATLQGYTQSLPSTNDGYIYIFLGTAYNATNVELVPNHPVYYHDGTALRLWTNAASGGGGGASVVTVTTEAQCEYLDISGTGLQSAFWRLWLDSASEFPSGGLLVNIDVDSNGYRIPAMYNTVDGCLLVSEAHAAETGEFSDGGYISVTCYFISF